MKKTGRTQQEVEDPCGSSSFKARLWLVFTLFSSFLLAVQCVQFKTLEGKLAQSL